MDKINENRALTHVDMAIENAMKVDCAVWNGWKGFVIRLLLGQERRADLWWSIQRMKEAQKELGKRSGGL